MICQDCKEKNVDTAWYCSKCGAGLTGSTASAEASNQTGGADSNGSPFAESIALDHDEITAVRSVAGQGVAAAPAKESGDEDETRAAAAASRSRAATVLEQSAPNAAEPPIGRTIESKYRIDAKLGAGGMGAVYRAHRLLIGDEVAIKILHPQHVSEPEANERFRREAQAAARLKHPNVVSIYDFGITADGLVFLVMELVEGQSLRQIIKQQGPLTPSAAAEILSQVCAALDEAHRQHIVHRDLKPDNVIVNPMVSGLRVKVLDFGIAKLRDLTAGNLTQTGSVMGTPHYMSPEQCLGEELDNRSDIYSLGIVLYEMLAGVVPFNSPKSTAVVIQQVNQAPPSLRTINLSISATVEAVVFHALAKKREDRPQTAQAFAVEFASAVSGTLQSARREPPITIPLTAGGRESAMTPTISLGRAGMPAGPGRSTAATPWPPVTTAKTRSMAFPLLIVAGVALLALGAVIALLLSGAFGSKNTNERANSNSQTLNSAVNSASSENRRAVATKTERPPPSTETTPVTPVVNPSVARAEVTSAMNVWADSLRRRSVSDNLSLYADHLDVFYGIRGVGKGTVRSNRQQIFNKYYSSTDVQLSNMRIDVDATGTRANVFYDNAYNWQGGSRYLSGKSHNEIIMARINGRWLIVSEIHLQQYYENKRD